MDGICRRDERESPFTAHTRSEVQEREMFRLPLLTLQFHAAWLTFDRNYTMARYTRQRDILLKTSEKAQRRVQRGIPVSLFFFLSYILRSRFYLFVAMQ